MGRKVETSILLDRPLCPKRALANQNVLSSEDCIHAHNHSNLNLLRKIVKDQEKKHSVVSLLEHLLSQVLVAVALSLPPVLIFQELFSINWLFVLCQTMQIYYNPAVFCCYWGKSVYNLHCFAAPPL